MRSPQVSYLPWCLLLGTLVDEISYGEACLYQVKLIRCQSDHDDYASSCGGVAMSGGDVMNSNT
jgi:hypothetical protein